MPTYTHGHAESVLRSHRSRTAENSAAYLLPYLRPDHRLLDVGAGPGTITFGKDGKPLYISGPYDDPRPVIRTLERTVGRGNFEFLAVAG